MDWIFDGIGTEIVSILISFIIGAVGGGLSGYKIAVRHTEKQHQKAGDNANQRQEGYEKTTTNALIDITSIEQSQNAGNNATQVQIGDINARK